MLKTPKFWYQKPGLVAYGLWPLGMLYGLIVTFIRWIKHFQEQSVTIPVISIGNLVMGGSGKTPTAIALAGILKEMGHTPHIITRGYGGCEKGPLLVNPECHTARDVGDEALLLARAAPTWVDAKRIDAARCAQAKGASILILDDAHQNQRLKKDLSLIVVDGQQQLGNGFVFPAGPLREFPAQSLVRADGVIWVERSLAAESRIKKIESRVADSFNSIISILNSNSLHATLTPAYDRKLLKTKVVAFSGLGFNQKFKDTLISQGFQIVHFEEYSDHHPYTEKDLETLLKIAQNYKAKLVTTAKDLVRIPVRFRPHVHVVEIELEFKHPQEVKEWLKSQNLS